MNGEAVKCPDRTWRRLGVAGQRDGVACERTWRSPTKVGRARFRPCVLGQIDTGGEANAEKAADFSRGRAIRLLCEDKRSIVNDWRSQDKKWEQPKKEERGK